MSLTEPDFSAATKRFVAAIQPHAPDLKLSASRDLFAKALYGVAYSQAMARCRANRLLQPLLVPTRISKAASDFQLDQAHVLDRLIGSIDAFANAQGDLEEYFMRGGVCLGLLAAQSPTSESGHLFTIALRALVRVMSPSCVVRGALTADTSPTLYSMVGARFGVVERTADSSYRSTLNRAISNVTRMDSDAFAFANISHDAIAGEAAEIVAACSRTIIVATDEALLSLTVRRAGRRNLGNQQKNMIAAIVDGRLELRPIQIGREALETYIDVPSHSAAFLLDRWQCRDGTTDPEESLFEAATNLTRDSLNRLQNPDGGRKSFRDALLLEGVPFGHATALADLFVERVQQSGA